jgi:hypothetical protein
MYLWISLVKIFLKLQTIGKVLYSIFRDGLRRLFNKEDTMAKVLGIHTVELKPGVNEQEFEEFIKTDVLPVYRRVPGQIVHLLKGDRGERTGKYLVLIELESVERRDDIYPPAGAGWGVAGDVQQLLGNVDPIWEKFSTFVEGFPDPDFTDYVMVSD